jgi:hypothetical protein
VATYPPPPSQKGRSPTFSGPNTPTQERNVFIPLKSVTNNKKLVQSLKDDDRKELIRMKALEQQKKLEEEEKR